VNKGIYLNFVQSPTTSGAGYFDMPVPIEIKGPGLDTTVIIIDRRGTLYNSATGTVAGSMIHYNLSATPTSLIFDPNSLVLATATLNASTTLPVLDISFSAIRNPGNTRLSWDITTNETLQSIIIEKSTDGRSFTVLTSLDAVRTTYDKYKGGMYDNSTDSGPVYYRLKAVKKDGGAAYSAVKMVETQSTAPLVITPNPVLGYLSLEMPPYFSESSIVTLLIYDGSGQLVKQEQIPGRQNNSITVYCEGYIPGVYEIVLINNKRQKLHAIFIKR
jgi:hypothetical protein